MTSTHSLNIDGRLRVAMASEAPQSRNRPIQESSAPTHASKPDSRVHARTKRPSAALAPSCWRETGRAMERGISQRNEISNKQNDESLQPSLSQRPQRATAKARAFVGGRTHSAGETTASQTHCAATHATNRPKTPIHPHNSNQKQTPNATPGQLPWRAEASKRQAAGRPARRQIAREHRIGRCKHQTKAKRTKKQ